MEKVDNIRGGMRPEPGGGELAASPCRWPPAQPLIRGLASLRTGSFPKQKLLLLRLGLQEQLGQRLRPCTQMLLMTGIAQAIHVLRSRRLHYTLPAKPRRTIGSHASHNTELPNKMS